MDFSLPGFSGALQVPHLVGCVQDLVQLQPEEVAELLQHVQEKKKTVQTAYYRLPSITETLSQRRAKQVWGLRELISSLYNHASGITVMHYSTSIPAGA